MKKEALHLDCQADACQLYTAQLPYASISVGSGQTYPIHDHSIQCCLALLVRAPAIPDGEVALLVLAHCAAL